MKHKAFTPEQVELLARRELNPAEYELVKDLTYSMILRNKYSGEYEIIEKA